MVDSTVPRRDGGEDAPERIGPFRILERIGEGGMGVVYLAERREPIEQRVALKVIRTGRLDKTYRARFAMEQAALARMDHPHIARLLDAGDDGGQSWFAMEHVPGVPLSTYCREHRLSIEARMQLFTQICDGVQHAHGKGILHRDLKPGNILVREIDGRPFAKIIDFGLAQPIDPLQIRATLHESLRQVVGTIAYMSPEQAQRTEGDLDIRTDVYSLGVVLYDLLTGEVPMDVEEMERRGLPWLGEFLREYQPKKPSTRLSDLGARLSTTAAERGVSVGRLRSRVRGDLDWVTMRALERDRQRRYVTVRELGRDVERWLRDEPVEAGPPSGWYVARKWLRRHARAVAVLAGVVLVAVGFAGMQLVHAAEREELMRRAALDREPLVAIGLLEEAKGLSVDLQRLPRWRAWLTQANGLLASEYDHRERLARCTSVAESEVFTAHLQETLPRLRRSIEEVQALCEEIEWIQDRMDQSAENWRACIDEIVADPRYGIAAMTPQFGLLPIGREPRSGLFEFQVLDRRTVDGRLQDVRRGPDGELTLGPNSAIVLVLLPGGDVRVGSDPGGDVTLDEQRKAEHPAHVVHIAPFFLGKYEATIDQFGRDLDPSFWGRRGVAAAAAVLRERGIDVPPMLEEETNLPVSNVSYTKACRCAERRGLRLPQESEWEYGARAGALGQWAFGDDAGLLRRYGNVVDRTARIVGVNPMEKDAGWYVDSDGYPAVSPIGTFLPNAYGLHDLHGNVMEWCADRLAFYDEVADDPLAPREDKRVVRGGSFRSPIHNTRSAARAEVSAEAGQRDLGFRFARDLVGASRR